MNKILENLQSKKLWATLAGCVYFALNGDISQVLILLTAYLGVQGLADITGALKK